MLQQRCPISPLSLTAEEKHRTLLSSSIEEIAVPRPARTEHLPGTLDLLVLRAVSLGRLHGYGVLLRIQQISRGQLVIGQGALYPALHRLQHQGFLATEWGTSENNRRAKYYKLTASGRRQLREETDRWTRSANAIGFALGALPQEG